MSRFARKIPLIGQIPTKYFDGGSRLTDYSLARLLQKIGCLLDGDSRGQGGILNIGLARGWTYQTNQAVGFAAGCYLHAPTHNDFSPAAALGDANVAYSAHVFVVTGAQTVDDLTIRVTGVSINDDGVRVVGDTEDIVIPAGTPANTYVEFKKWLGTVAIEAVSGTPVDCNYGWSKYYDANNQDFILVGLEALWESDSTDATSDIELIHHKTEGWTYNGGSSATPPTPLVSRSSDLAPDDVHAVGCGAWKRANLDQLIKGSESEGILFRLTSGSTGVGSLSFRALNLEVTLRPLD